jgi:hypothetical protein
VDVPERLRKRTLSWDPRDHPLLGGLVPAPGSAPLVVIRRELAWDVLPSRAQAPILSAAGRPFLLAGACGDGQVLLFAVPADRTWSSFPLSPFFLPIVHEVVRYGAGAVRENPYLWTTSSFSLAEVLPRFGRESALHDPGGAEVAVRSTLVGNRPRLETGSMLRPGVYTFRASRDEGPLPAFALNMDRAESDLTPLDRSGIADLIGARTVVLAGSKEELARLVNEYRVGRSLGELALWLALGMAALEVFYANHRARQPPSLLLLNGEAGYFTKKLNIGKTALQHVVSV